MATLALHARERDTLIIRASFTDDAGAAAAPTAIAWTLMDADGAVVNDRESVTETPAATMYFVLTDEDLAGSGTRYLLIEGTYDSDYGTGLSLRDQVQFEIDDLVGV